MEPKKQRPAQGLGVMNMDVGIDVSPQRGVLNSPMDAVYFWLDVIWIKINKVYQNQQW